MNTNTPRLAAATFETHEAIMVTDSNGTILRVNAAFRQITGYSPDEAIGKTPDILSSGRHDKTFFTAMWQKLSEDGTWEGEIWNRHKSGQIYPTWLTITALKDAQGKTIQYVASFNDVADRKQNDEEIHACEFYDPLTKLPNRHLLLERLNSSLSVSERTKHYGAVLFLNMDNFKILNDTLGYNKGDLILIEIAERLRFHMRAVDTIARLGGDEFVVLAVNLGLIEENATRKAALIAEKIRTVLSVPYHFEGLVQHSSPSIGVRLFRGDKVPVDELIRNADIAMYQAKNAGRNTVRFFDPLMRKSI